MLQAQLLIVFYIAPALICLAYYRQLKMSEEPVLGIDSRVDRLRWGRGFRNAAFLPVVNVLVGYFMAVIDALALLVYLFYVLAYAVRLLFGKLVLAITRLFYRTFFVHARQMTQEGIVFIRYSINRKCTVYSIPERRMMVENEDYVRFAGFFYFISPQFDNGNLPDTFIFFITVRKGRQKPECYEQKNTYTPGAIAGKSQDSPSGAPDQAGNPRVDI